MSLPPLDLKECRCRVKAWIDYAPDTPSNIVPDLRPLVVEELIAPTDPHEEALPYYRDMRKHGEARRQDLHTCLHHSLSSHDANQVLHQTSSDWRGKNEQRPRAAKHDVDQLVITCADQAGAWHVFNNLAHLQQSSPSWLGLLLPRLAVSKLSPKLWRPLTEEKIAVCCHALVKQAPKFRNYVGLAQAITFFQNACWWEWNAQLGVAGQISDSFDNNLIAFAGQIDCDATGTKPSTASEKARARLWALICQCLTDPASRIRFYVLVLLREFSDADQRVSWKEIGDALVPQPPATVPAIAGANGLVADDDLPLGSRRKDVASAFAGASAEWRSVQKFYTRTRNALVAGKHAWIG